ncbi:Riboflavin biosynthesis protein RibF [Microbacterium oxydans]|uniref:riboflavin kinase n=1 Tax=Microbacterium oxydans TaxID=82380 RepID=UPI001E14E51E|nr:riboflavin kinase [Microbacterium oxydans]CAH0154809.1 Riboflavin biosynthesis protein RibF [Microbacterium oxydans]
MITSPLAVITGVVVPGDGRGRVLGFPTANLECEPPALPDDGIYAAWVRVDDDPHPWAASVSVGTNPTFAGARERRIEVHLHDVEIDLYGRMLTVDLVARLRPTLRFDAVDDLIEQTADDVARCRALLDAAAGTGS